MSNVKAVIEVPSLIGTPARANHITGVIEVSKSHFSKLPEIYKQFIIGHEEGHLNLNTRDEYAADEYAMNKLLANGYPLTKILESLTRVLSFNDPQHYGRSLNLFNNLRNYDYLTNNNNRVLKNINTTKMETQNSTFDIYEESINPHSNFAWLAAVPSIMQGVGGMFGKGGGGGDDEGQDQSALFQMQMTQQQQQQQQQADKAAADKRNMLIIIVVVVVIVIIAAMFMMKGKK